MEVPFQMSQVELLDVLSEGKLVGGRIGENGVRIAIVEDPHGNSRDVNLGPDRTVSAPPIRTRGGATFCPMGNASIGA